LQQQVQRGIRAEVQVPAQHQTQAANGKVRVFRQKFTLDDAFGSDAC
jgi:hypothetical protein